MAKFLAVFCIAALSTVIFSFSPVKNTVFYMHSDSSVLDSGQRKATLARILAVLPADDERKGPVSFYDNTFRDWLSRTGELPPDFDQMPSIPFLPDPLVHEVKGKSVLITSKAQWETRRLWLKDQIRYYLSGTFPEQPDNLDAVIIKEEKDGQVLLQEVLLKFGPGNKATLTIEMMIPPGKGPFPVFMTQWNHREWAQLAVKRGYAACIMANADIRDDTEEYGRIWAGRHDFTRLMRRAFGSFVAVDYLYTLPFIDKKKIGIAGHSRNGKLSMLAGVFDDRITAVVSSSGGSGAEIPWRYTTPQYVVEDIALLTSAQPAWFHPRLRFFIGNENKLPVDQNTYMALIAPRGLLLSTSVNESAANPWGAEQAFQSARQVYRFLGAEDQLAVRFRNGFHGTSARDIEDYIDFFDYIFQRGAPKPESRLLYNYSFEGWKVHSGEKINPLNWPEKDLDDILSNADGKSIHNAKNWEVKRESILKNIRWVMGEEPAGVRNKGPQKVQNGGEGEDSFGSFLPRPVETSAMGIMKITPYKAFGDYLYGNLYYPKDKVKPGQEQKLPAIIYLHPYDYSKGFSTIDHQYGIQSFFEKLTSQGYVVFAFDMIGFGNRIDEGTRFYERYPNWSKMGKIVSDVRSAVDALENLEMIDKNKIYIAGYALGATAGLCATALDPRIAGTIAVAGFTPMRTSRPGTEGIRAFSHLHGLLPRLGFFVDHEARIPFGFHEVLGAIAPRPLMIIAPKNDWNAVLPDIEKAVHEASRIYKLYPRQADLEFIAPESESRFSDEIQAFIFQWFDNR
jgi:cephalosporin-C deacetylase-like acetyl esterase